MDIAPQKSLPTLSIRNLTIEYQGKRGYVQAVRNISLEINRNESLALIGESGSGKTTIGMGIVRLLPSTAKIRQGELLFRRNISKGHSLEEEIDIIKMNERELRAFRWRGCTMVFQAALNAFNPVL